MSGQLVPLVLIPRFSSYVGAGTFVTVGMDVSDYQKAIVNVWRGALTGSSPTFLISFEESTDQDSWSTCAGGTPADPGALTEAQYTPTLGKRWFRTKLVLGGSQPPDDLPANVVTTYGMTETGSGVIYDGRALDDVEMRPAEVGMIVTRDVARAAWNGNPWNIRESAGTITMPPPIPKRIEERPARTPATIATKPAATGARSSVMIPDPSPVCAETNIR